MRPHRQFLKKLSIKLTYKSENQLLGIHLKHKKKPLPIKKNIGTTIFIAALFIIAKVWEQAKFPPTGELIWKM